MRRIGKLEVISFITGFSLLTYELAAARVLAPSIGSSTYVWTSVIGIIIASLALGFWVGGKLADMRDHASDLVWLLGIASVMVLMTQASYPFILSLAVVIADDVRLQAVFAALMLFAPTSFMIGTTSPYLAKLNVRSLKTTGQHIASLDAFNSLGGITGTFLTGFVLFGFAGSRQTFALVALLLIAVSWLIVPRYRWRQRAVFTGLVAIACLLPAPAAPNIVNIDTASAHYQVAQFTYNGRSATGLVTGPAGVQSAVYDDSNELVFWYNRELARVAQREQPQRILILGGGAFTLPQYLAQKLPGSQIDVVEIDPELKAISERYFQYKNPRNVQLIFTDARSYVNQTKAEYDLVVVDVYGDTSIPFSLMTQEFGQKLERRVAPGGKVAVNLIASTSGRCRELFAAVDAVYRQGFIYAQYSSEQPGAAVRDNNIIIYARQRFAMPGMKELPVFETEPYTDNHMPAERLHFGCQQG